MKKPLFVKAAAILLLARLMSVSAFATTSLPSQTNLWDTGVCGSLGLPYDTATKKCRLPTPQERCQELGFTWADAKCVVSGSGGGGGSIDGKCGLAQYAKGMTSDNKLICQDFGQKDVAAMNDPQGLGDWCGSSWLREDFRLSCPANKPAMIGIKALYSPSDKKLGAAAICVDPRSDGTQTVEVATPFYRGMPCRRNENWVSWGGLNWELRCDPGSIMVGLKQVATSTDFSQTPYILCSKPMPDGTYENYERTSVAAAGQSLRTPRSLGGYGEDPGWGYERRPWEKSCGSDAYMSGFGQTGGNKPLLICRGP